MMSVFLQFLTLLVLTIFSWSSSAQTMKEVFQKYNAKVQQNNSTRSLIYQCTSGCGGIGDRLRAMTMIFYLAVASRRRFYILMHNPFPLETVFQPVELDWRHHGRKCGKSLRAIDNNNGLPFDQIGRVDDPFGNVDDVCILSNMYGSGRIVAAARAVFGESNATQGKTEGQLFGEAMRFLFEPTAALLTLMRDMERDVGLVANRNCTFCIAQWPDEPWLAVHFRVGGTQGSWKDPIRDTVQFASNISSCALQVRQCYLAGSLNATIFVASDSHTAKSTITPLVNGRSVTIAIAHTDRSKANVDGHMHAWAEFVLLTRATCIVASQSGFQNMLRGRHCRPTTPMEDIVAITIGAIAQVPLRNSTYSIALDFVDRRLLTVATLLRDTLLR
jgi:hypothetical protein